MATNRRKPPPHEQNGSPTSEPVSPNSIPSQPPTLGNPFLPTPNELLLLSIYPATLALGHLYSFVSPTTRHVPYDAVAQSHPSASAPSYFARKDNLFNVFFVKVGWLWTTAALVLLIATHPSFGIVQQLTGGRERAGRLRRAGQVVLRWAGCTTVWYLVTQWCFGPGLVDRSFSWTGGRCEVLQNPAIIEEMSPAQEVFTRVACKASGGQWRGGHDISGHVFMLVLGSAMVAAELLPTVTRRTTLVFGPNGRVTDVGSDAHDSESTGLGVKAAGAYLALSWWMLLMTALYFHTWFEKVTGLIVGLLGFWLVYYLPRGVPSVRAIVGLPGL